MRVLLLGPPWGDIYGDFKRAAKVGVYYPPLGLCYIASALQTGGHETLVVDCEAEGKSLLDVVALIEETQPDLIGIQVVSPLYDVVLELCKAIRSAGDQPIVLGGPHITITKGEAFEQNPYFDYAIFGEGEFSMLALANALEQGDVVDGLAGIIKRDSQGKLIEGPARVSPSNLDEYPMPDRAGLPMDRYLFSVPGRGNQAFATITSTRGCPFECTFCTEPMMFGRKTRFRSPENVVAEIEHANEVHGVTHFIFVDDTLTVEKSRIVKICDLIIERKLDITLEGWTHANTITEPLLRKMKQAGLVRLSFGIESGDPDILASLKKGTTHEKIRAAYKAAKKVGIETRGSVIIGLPGDTIESVNRTIQFCKDLKEIDHCYFNIAMPYPGTEIRALALAGEKGVTLLSEEYSILKRQGQSVVMEVNDLKAPDLLRLQREAYRAFWLTPRRIFYNLHRAGFKAGLQNSWAFFRSFIMPPGKSLKGRMTFLSDITSISSKTGDASSG